MKNKVLYTLLCAACSTLVHTKQQAMTTIYLHGIVDTQEQHQRYAETLPHDTTVKSFDFPDAQEPESPCWWSPKDQLNHLIYKITKKCGKTLNREQEHLGQSKDLTYAEQQIQKENDDTPKILYGVSRGGSVALKYIAETHDPSVKALVIESAPNDLEHKAEEIHAHIGLPISTEIVMKGAFPAYNKNERFTLTKELMQQLKAYQNKNLPVLIVHSKTDKRVPYTDSLAYYVTLKELGFKNVYLLLLEQGRHSFILTDNPNSSEAQTYTKVAHSFYKAHQLPYNKKHAHVQTKELQQRYQPDPIIVKKELGTLQQIRKEKLENTYNNSKKRNIIVCCVACAVGLAYGYKKYTS